MVLRFMKIISLLSLQQLYLATAKPHHHQNQAYLDVEPADTARFLDVIRKVKISTYRLSYERSSTKRLRIGVIGPELAETAPEAVELVPKRVLPPIEKGGKHVVLHNVSEVNENVLFMLGVGATQELIGKVDTLSESISSQVEEMTALFQETAKLEHLILQSSNEKAKLEIKASVAEAEIAYFEYERERRRFEEETKYLELQRQLEVEQIKQNEEMTLSRLAQEEETARNRANEEMALRFEGSRRIERSRNSAAEELSLMQYDRDVALQKASEEMKARSAKAIAEAKADAERANEDVHIRKLKAEAEQSRKKSIAAINAIAGQIASSLYSASTNPRQVFVFIWYLAALATGIYSAKEMARLCRVIVESTLGKPKLIRETSRKSLPYQIISNLFDSCIGYYGLREEVEIEKNFDDVALESDLKEKVLSIAYSASKVRKNDAPHRHTLFFGPPGTGKTMVAKKLSSSIGMDYALMSGGDVGPLGSDAVTQIHNLFRWAKFSKNGVLLFIDEAEAFLGDRRKNSMSEHAHNALNALLYNTGSERTDFMMVLATNRAEDLDAAILDRCDESLLFPLPSKVPRSKLVQDYFKLYVRSMVDQSNEQNKSAHFMARIKSMFIPEEQFQASIEKNAMGKEMIAFIVEATSGFSGREIAKLMIALQGAIYASSDGVLTSTKITSLVRIKVEEHNMKVQMTNGEKATAKVHNATAKIDDKTNVEICAKTRSVDIKPHAERHCFPTAENGDDSPIGTSKGLTHDSESLPKPNRNIINLVPVNNASTPDAKGPITNEVNFEEKSDCDLSYDNSSHDDNANKDDGNVNNDETSMSDLSSSVLEKKHETTIEPKMLESNDIQTPRCSCDLM